MTPYFTETVTESAYQMRLTSIGARFIPSRSQPNRYIFWAPGSDTWVVGTPKGRKIKLEYYRHHCPCGV